MVRHKPTRWHRPDTLSGALDVLCKGVIPVAGCTDLMVVNHATDRNHAEVVDLMRIPELQGIRSDGSWLDLGAACTFSLLRDHPLVRAHVPVLADVAMTIGAWQIQNRATLGGNIANASPAGDSLPVLLALDAELVLASKRGERTIAHTDMHRGYRHTALEPDELIMRVRIPIDRPRDVQLLRKVGTREAQAISKVVVAFTARREGQVLCDVRIAAGSVAPVPLRLTDAERVCERRPADAKTAEQAATAAVAQITPIDDVRSKAGYRRFVAERLIRRMVLVAGAAS